MGFIDKVVNKLANSIVAKQKAKEVEVIKEVEVVKEVVKEVNVGPNTDDLIDSLNYLAKISLEISNKHEDSSIMLLSSTGKTGQHASSIVGGNRSLQLALMEACKKSEGFRNLVCDVAQEILLSEMKNEDEIESSQRLRDILSDSRSSERAFEIPTSKIDNLSNDDIDDIISKILGPKKDKPGKDS